MGTAILALPFFLFISPGSCRMRSGAFFFSLIHFAWLVGDAGVVSFWVVSHRLCLVLLLSRTFSIVSSSQPYFSHWVLWGGLFSSFLGYMGGFHSMLGFNCWTFWCMGCVVVFRHNSCIIVILFMCWGKCKFIRYTWLVKG